MRRAYLAWLVVCVVWGTTYLAIRISIESLPPLLMAGSRWTIAGALLVAILGLRGERMPALPSWPALAAIGVLMMGLGNGGVVLAERAVPSGLTAILVATSAFWLVGTDAVTGGDRLTPRRVLGLLVGFGGIVLLVWPEITATSGREFLRGVIATQVACCGWAIGSTYSRRRPQHENVLTLAAFEMLFGGLALLAVAMLREESATVAISQRSIAAFVYLIGIGSIVGFTAYAYALKHLPIATVSLYAYINPVLAVIFGTLILSEPLTARIIVAAAIVLLGLGLVQREARRGRAGQVGREGQVGQS